MKAPYLLALLLCMNLQFVNAQERAEAEVLTEFKVAVIDIQELFKGYHKTLLAEKEINEARAEIEKESQLAANNIYALRQQVQKMKSQFETGTLSHEEASEMKREGPILMRELRQKEKEKEAKRDAASQRLNRQMVRRMQRILGEIKTLAQEYAEESGLDLVIDRSGTNSNQVQPIPFIKDAIDITGEVKEVLEKKEKVSP